MNNENLIDTTSPSESSAAERLSSEQAKKIAKQCYEISSEPEKNEQDEDTISLNEERLWLAENQTENNPLLYIFAALFITGALAVAVLFVWTLFGKITDGHNLAQDRTVKPAKTHQEQQPDPKERYEAEMALIEQQGDLQAQPEPNT